MYRDTDHLYFASLYFPGPCPQKALNKYLLISLLNLEIFTLVYLTYFVGC